MSDTVVPVTAARKRPRADANDREDGLTIEGLLDELSEARAKLEASESARRALQERLDSAERELARFRASTPEVRVVSASGNSHGRPHPRRQDVQAKVGQPVRASIGTSSSPSTTGSILPLFFFEANVPTDCKVLILSYLTQHELYINYALASKRCRADSLQRRLPQMQEGTIRCGRDLHALLRRLSHPSFRTAFPVGGSRTHLILTGFPKPPHCGNKSRASIVPMKVRDAKPYVSSAALPGVMSLRVDYHADTSYIHVAMNILSKLLPNLRDLDLTGMGTPVFSDKREVNCFGRNCKRIEVIRTKSNRRFGCLYADGSLLGPFEKVSELYLDNIRFFLKGGELDGERYLFCDFPGRLTRVSILNATWAGWSRGMLGVVDQAALMKFVRNTPTLRWFRSDLTPENVAVLQGERPEVTFL